MGERSLIGREMLGWTAFCVLSVTSFEALADPLPFPDGRYVVDLALCPFTTEQLSFEYGDGIHSFVRHIDGPNLDDTYEGSCEITSVTRNGPRINFEAACHAEGEAYDRTDTFEEANFRTFRHQGLTFLHCPSFLEASTALATNGSTTCDDGLWVYELDKENLTGWHHLLDGSPIPDETAHFEGFDLVLNRGDEVLRYQTIGGGTGIRSRAGRLVDGQESDPRREISYLFYDLSRYVRSDVPDHVLAINGELYWPRCEARTGPN
jgi:hypothetical protein